MKKKPLNINHLLEYQNNTKLLVILIFSLLLIVGITIFDDYGISWDEYSHRANGFVSLNFVREYFDFDAYPGFPKLENYFAAQYGVLFDLPMSFLEKKLLIEDSKNQILLRHFFNFIIFFISNIFFYLILNKRFTKKISIIGLLFLILSPRIFADSFYNMKDLVFLSFFIISIFFAINFLDNISYKNAFLASIACSFVVAVRIIGVMIPFIIIIFFILKSLDAKKYFKENILKIIFFLTSSIVFTIIFWPYLWNDPINNFLNTFQNMSSYTWRGSVFYMGEYISAMNLPWHYPIVWISITTPILYLLLFALGSALVFLRLLNRFFELGPENKINDLWKSKKELIDLIMLLIFYLTIFLVIKINSTLYGGWRHLYFIYPCLIFISISGLEFILRKLNLKYLLVIVVPFLIYNAIWMVKNHPFQFVYFNILAGKNINNNFELDYWGTSNKEALKYIVNNDKKNDLKIYVLSDSPYHFSLLFIDKEKRKRIEIVNNIKDADYLVTNHYYTWGNRRKLEDNPTKINKNLKEKFILLREFKVDKMPINSIYKVN